ncbi:RT0821/Lpp0805 family surface protein [Thioalkalivibrio nitratireducens]|uniref:RT0821/Lpp0805 family surface protein n=1 Tax=Thioalkalivibrio nitratireducens TaxID=186931 RepID=UPI0005C1BB61|nr:RT0821/Lpp0805 family surface protein [Thioalkalivibrio nitratireducens]
MQGKIFASLLLAAGVGLPGCATYQVPQEQVGMVIGGVLGGVLGRQIGAGTGRDAAIIAGTLAGAAIGGAVGRTMDDMDRLRTAQTLESVRTGVSTAWVNPDSGVQYQVTPTRTFEAATGPCREYTVDAMIGGRVEQVYGTACRQPDGSWRVLE